MTILALFCAEIIVSLPGIRFASAEPGPEEDWDGTISEWFAVKNPTRFRYKWHGCNGSYLMLDIKDTSNGTDYLNFTVDGEEYVATFGHNTWGLDLPVENWTDPACKRQVHEICFTPGSQHYIDSAWVQPAILASGNATGTLESYVQIPFFAGGDVVICLQPEGSYLDLGVQVTDGANETETVTLKRTDYKNLYPGTTPDADCATVAGAIEGRLANRFETHLQYPGNHTLRVRTAGAFDYVLVAGGGVDIDGDKLTDAEEDENYGEAGYHPLVPSAWAFRIGEADHPTFWDYLQKNPDSLSDFNLSAYQETLQNTHFSAGMAIYIPPSWRLQSGGLALYADVEAGAAENFTLDGAPAYINDTVVWGFDDVAGPGMDLIGVNEWGSQVSVPTEGMMSFTPIFLGYVDTGWHTVGWWVNAEAEAFLGTRVNLRINQYAVPVLDKSWADVDADNLADEWEVQHGSNPDTVDTDGDEMLDPVDVSQDASLLLPAGTINQVILPVTPGRDARVHIQVHPPEMDLTENTSLEWNPPGSTGIGTQVFLIPGLRIYGSGNSEEVDYWTNRAGLATFWGKNIATYALADVADSTIAGDAGPLPTTAAEAGLYYTFLMPEDVTPYSWQFTLQIASDYPLLVSKHYIDLRFDFVYLLVTQAWQNASDQSILRWYEVEEPLLLQGLSVTEVGDVAWALGSPDNAEEASVIFSTVINPSLGNPTNYGLTGATAPNPDVIGWGSGQLLYPRFNPDPTNPVTLGVADRIAAARKAHPRAEDEAEVTFYGCTERTYNALGWINKSAKVDPNTGQVYCAYPGNDFAGIADNNPLPTISGWTVDPTTRDMGLARLRRNAQNRAKVAELVPYYSISAIVAKNASGAASEGIVELWVYRPAGGAPGKVLNIELLDAAGQVAAQLQVNNATLQVYNYTTSLWVEIGEIWDGEWFQVIVDFNCTAGTSDVVVGGVSCDWAPRCGLAPGASGIQQVRFTAQGAPFVIDGVQFSWDASYDPSGPEFFNALLGSDTTRRHAWYTISDIYGGRYEVDDPMLAGEDVVAWETYWSNDLHEELRCVVSRFPVDIDFIRADEANAWTPNPGTDGFEKADCLKVTSVVGDVLPVYLPTTLAAMENEQDPNIKRAQGALVYYHEYAVEMINDDAPPAVLYDLFDDVKAQVDLREHFVDRISYWFEPHSYSLWKQWLARLKLLEYYSKQDDLAMDQFISVLDEYFTAGGAHCANPLEITWQMRVPQNGILFTDRVSEFIESYPTGTYDAYNPPVTSGPHTFLELKKIVFQIRQGVPLDQIPGLTFSPEDGTYRYYGKEYERGKFGITCRVTAPSIRQMAINNKEARVQYFKEQRLPVGTPIETLVYSPSPEFGTAASMNQVKTLVLTDFTEKAMANKAAIWGKQEPWGVGFNLFHKQMNEVPKRIKGFLLNGVPIIGDQLEIVDFALACGLNRKYGGFAWFPYSTTQTNAPTAVGGFYMWMEDEAGNVVTTGGTKVFTHLFERLRQEAPTCVKTAQDVIIVREKLDAIETVWRSSPVHAGIKALNAKVHVPKIMTQDRAFELGRWEKRGASSVPVLILTNEHEVFALRPLANIFIERLAIRMGVDILDHKLSGVVESVALTQIIVDLANKDMKKIEEFFRSILINVIHEWVPDGTFQYFQEWTMDALNQAGTLCPALAPVFTTISTLVNEIMAEGLGKTGNNPWIQKMQVNLAAEARRDNFILRGAQKVFHDIIINNQVPFRYHYFNAAGKETVVTFQVACYGGLVPESNPAWDKYYSIGINPEISLNEEIYVGKDGVYLGNPNWGLYPIYGWLSKDDIRCMNRGGRYAYVYDGFYLGNEEDLPTYDPAIVVWMLGLLSHGRLTPSNVAHDVARQWLTVIQQADITAAQEIMIQIQVLAGILIIMGFVQGVIALGSAVAGGVGTQTNQAFIDQSRQAAQVFAGGVPGIFSAFELDWSTFEASLVSALKLYDMITGGIIIAAGIVGGMAAMSAAFSVLSWFNIVLGIELSVFSWTYNQFLEYESRVSANMGIGVDIPDLARRELVRHGAFECSQEIAISIDINNTGYLEYIYGQYGYYPNAGNGSTFKYHARVACGTPSSTPQFSTPWKATAFLSHNKIYLDSPLRNVAAESATLDFMVPLPDTPTLNPWVFWENYFTLNLLDSPTTPIDGDHFALGPFGIYVTERTLEGFLAHCRPAERAVVENKAWDFLVAAWEGRFKDAGDAVDQAIAAVGLIPDEFNATFGNAIPKYQGEPVGNDLHIDRCLDCGANFNKTLGYCTRCGWKLDHYGVFVPYAPVWHDLMTRYFAEGFRALRPTPGGAFFTPTVEWQASEMAHSVSNGMLLVPADWLARKNQSMPLLRALCGARANFTLNANLDVTPSWGGILEVPANGTTSGRLYFTVEGPDNPAVKADLILPDGFAGSLFTGHYKGTESFTAGLDWTDWNFDWTWGNPNVSITPWYLDHRNVMCIDDSSPTKTIRAGYDFVNKPQARGTVEFWVANPNTGPDQALSWSLDESTYFYNYYPLITGMLKAGQIWTTNGASQVVVGTYDPAKWVHVRVAFGDPRVPLTYPYAFNYSLWIDGAFAGEFTYTHPEDYTGTFRGLSFFSTTLGTGSFYVDAIGYDFAPGYHVGDNWHLDDVPGEEVFPLQDLPSLEFEIHPRSSHTPAGFYTATVNITYTNGTRIMAITIPFRYAWDQRTGLEFLALPDTVIPGDVVRWGKVTNTGTEPGAFLVDTDGIPADWLQSTGKVALVYVGFDQGLDGFTLASASSGPPNFTITQPIEVATYVNPSAPDTCFGASSLIIPGIAQWVYFGVPNLPPNTPFVAPRGTSAFFFMDYAEHDAPYSTWDLFPAPVLDEGTLTWANIPDMGEWWKNVLYKQPAAFAFDWVMFPNLSPGGNYILQQGLSRFRLRSDDFPEFATRPFAGTTYDKVLADAGMLVIQTNESETITLNKPVTWALQAGDTITIRYSINGPGHVTLTLDGQSFEIIRAGNIQYGSQSKSFTLPQNLTASAITIEADLAAGTVFRVDAITAERLLTLSAQASNGIAGGIYNGTIDLHDAIGFTSLARYAFDSGTEGWAGSFASGEKNFTVTDYAALTYVDQRNPGSSFKNPEIVLSSSRFFMYAYLMDASRERYFPGFIPDEFLLQLRLQHVVPATLWAWACNPWDPVNNQYNGQPLSYDNQPWYFGKVVTSAATTGIPDGGWLTVHGMAPGPFFLYTDQMFGTMELYGSYGFDYYPKTITVFENFGAAEGHLLFQADQADSFTAHREVDLQLRQGDRVRVSFTTTGTQLVTLRVGSTSFTLVPAGNAAFGPQEAVFTIPVDMHVTQLEIAGYLDTAQYLHMDTIAIERPAQVLPYVYGHRDVLALGAAASGVIGAEYAINSPLAGTIEMWVAGSNLTSPLAIELAGDNGIARLGFEHEELRAWNGTNIITLARFSAWTGWTHLRVDFDLVTDSFTVWVNNVTVARDLLLTTAGDVTTLQSIRLATTLGDHSYFVDAIACSWIDITYNLGDNLWPAWIAGCEQLFFVAPGESRSLEIAVPRLYSIAPGPRQFVAKVVDPVTRRLLGVYSGTVNVGAFYDIGLEVLPVHAAGMPGTQSTYVVRVTNLGNVPQTITLACEGTTIAGWSFATPSAALAPGQTFASELAVDPAVFEAGVQWFTVLAGAALNSTALGASYVVNDVPALSTPPDFSYESGTTGHAIRWDIEDTYLNSSVAAWNLSRAILGDISVPVANGSWNDSREITMPVDGLSAGTFVYELDILDGFGGTAQDKLVLVVTQDGVAYLPQVNSTDAPAGENQVYATPLGNGTLEVAFNATTEVTLVVGAWDDNPTGLDPGFAGEGLYFAVEASNQAAVTFPMYVTVPLPAGIPPNATEQEIAEMIVPFTFDEVTGNWTQEDFAVTVDILDGTATVAVTHLSQFAVGVLNFPPTISCPPDLYFEVGTPGQAVTWVVTDETITRPTYQVICNDMPYAGGPWQTGMLITVPVSGFEVGTYFLTAGLSDGRGATVTDDVQVTVQPAITSIECGAVPDTAAGITLKVTAIGASAVVVEFHGETYPTIKAGNDYVAFLPNPQVIGAHAARVIAWHGSISTTRDITIDVVNTVPRVHLYYSSAGSAGDYPGTYTFSDRDLVPFSTGWVAGVQEIQGQPVPGVFSDYCRILPEHAGHADVLQLFKNSSVAQVIAAYFAGYEIPSGSVELWVAVEGDASFMAALSTFTAGISVWIVVVQGQLAFVNADGIVTWLGAFSPGWHRLEIEFAGAGTSIPGLPENQIALTLDNTSFAALDAGAPLHVTGFAAAASQVGNASSPAEGSLYLDAVDFSWDSNYVSGRNRAPGIFLPQAPAPEVTIIAGEDGAALQWLPLDVASVNPQYEIFLDGALVTSVSWASGTLITWDISGIEPGDYNVEMVLDDGMGGVVTSQVFLHVQSSSGAVLDEIDELIRLIEASADSDWKKPASPRKQWMIDKLNEVKALVLAGNLDEAYDKLLHDIKPKLTGLKTNEDEIPWGNGIYNCPWVTSPALRQECKDLINSILRGLSPESGGTPPPCHHGWHCHPHHHAHGHHASPHGGCHHSAHHSNTTSKKPCRN